MSRTTCLPQVPKDRFITIRKWQIAFCDGDICAAALISFFGKYQTQTIQPYIMDKIIEGILNLYKKDKISKSIKLLIDKKVITKHKNTKSKFNKVICYSFSTQPLHLFCNKYKEK